MAELEPARRVMQIHVDTCFHHTDVEHTAAHEAGHAVAAIRLGVPFHHLVMHPEPVPLPWKPEWMSPGWTKIDLEPAMLLPPLTLLEFALAGTVAEEFVLGDQLPGGWEGDLLNWRAMVNAWGSLPNDAFIPIVGERLSDVIVRVRARTTDDRAVIAAVASTATATGELSAAQVEKLVRG